MTLGLSESLLTAWRLISHPASSPPLTGLLGVRVARHVAWELLGEAGWRRHHQRRMGEGGTFLRMGLGVPSPLEVCLSCISLLYTPS